MEWLKQLIRILFPFRTHLLEEIDMLRAQLAQRNRRIDELQESLLLIVKPAPPRPIPTLRTPVNVKPVGWDSVRASRPVPPLPPIDSKSEVHENVQLQKG